MSVLANHSLVTSYGCNRSVVRMVATLLPIDTGQRVYIQLPHVGGSYPSSPSGSHGGMFDLTSLLKDPSMLLGKQLSMESNNQETKDINKREDEHEPEEMSQGIEGSATKRISSLEAELARLKAQMATYALKETENMEDVAPPLPPPPPPLPLPAGSSTTTNTNTTASSIATSEATPSKPPLTTVLKDIGSVKLRAVDVERSPGGTPFRPKRSQSLDNPSMDDPASIIAHALRKKFSHRIFQDSPDKEILDKSDCSFNEFDSPISGTPASKTLQFESSTQNDY